MNANELKKHLRRLQVDYGQQSTAVRIEIAKDLLRAASTCVRQLRKDLREGDAASNRRKAKRRETEVDPKPPVKPVRVAEPSKPRKPKYSGNHAPSAPRR